MRMTILCAVDGSNHSDKAAEIAADLALVHSADLHFVHVLMRDLGFGNLGKFASNAHLKDIIANEQRELTEIMTSGKIAFVPGACEAVILQLSEIILFDAEEVARKKGVESLSSAVLDGSSADEILVFAGKRQADMIIMGTRGLSGVRNFLLGSVSQKILNHAPSTCTCVCVK